MFQFGCTRCGKQCKNAGGLATHMKTHTKKKVDSPSLLRFFKRAPAKKFAVELKPIKKKPQQIKLRAKARPKPLRPPQISRPSAPPIPSEDVPPPPPRRPRSTCSSTSDLSHYVAPESIISSRLDKRSPEFRVAHVRYFRKLKEDGFPMLDMSAYFAANESSLGVKLRRFHQWFREYEDDLQKIAKKAKPKPKKPRHQNKVVCQAERKRWTATQKLAEREEFSDEEESDAEDAADKDDDFGEIEIPLKRVKAQKAPRKRLLIPKKQIREKNSAPRKRRRKQPPGPPPGPPPKRRRKPDIKPSSIVSKKI